MSKDDNANGMRNDDSTNERNKEEKRNVKMEELLENEFKRVKKEMNWQK